MRPPAPGDGGHRAKPAKEVTTGFGVELSEVRRENLRPALPSLSAWEPFGEAIGLGPSRGAMPWLSGITWFRRMDLAAAIKPKRFLP